MMKRGRKLSCNLNLEEDTTKSLTSVLWHKRASAHLISLIRSVCNSRCSFSRLRLSPLSNPPPLFPSQAPSVNYAADPASSRCLVFLMYICRQDVRSRTKFPTNGLTRMLSAALWRGPVSSAAFCFLSPGPFVRTRGIANGNGAGAAGEGKQPHVASSTPRVPAGWCLERAGSALGKRAVFPLFLWRRPGRGSAPPAGCSTARLRGGELAHRLTPRPPGSAVLGCPARSAGCSPAWSRMVGVTPGGFIPTDYQHLCNQGRLHLIRV